MPIRLTPAKAAILLGISDRTVRSLIQRRLLCATPVGSRLGGRKGPTRYEISLEALQATGLPLDLTRLPLLASMSQRAKAAELELAGQDATSILIQTLKEEQTKMQALRVELEQTLTEIQHQLARLETREAALTIPSMRPLPEHLSHESARIPAQSASGSLVEGPPSGLTPLWIEGIGARIRYNATRHLLVIDSSIVALSPTEYQLVIELFTQYAQWQARRQAGCFLAEQVLLQQSAGLSSPHLLSRHISHINFKLAPFGVRVPWIAGSGYTLFVDNTVIPTCEDRSIRRARRSSPFQR